MDPNACRARMIEKANLVLGRLANRDNLGTLHDIADDATDLAEAVHDMDGWLRAKGFLPDAWLVNEAYVAGSPAGQIGRKQDVAPEKPLGVMDIDALYRAHEGKEVDDERPRVDGSKCGHPLSAIGSPPLLCDLDRGHEGPHA